MSNTKRSNTAVKATIAFAGLVYAIVLLLAQGLYTGIFALAFAIVTLPVLLFIIHGNQRRGIACVAMLGMAILLLDGACKYLLKHPEQVPAPLVKIIKYHYKIDRNVLQYDHGRYDPEVSYTLKPGIWTFENTEFRHEVSVNSLGVRDDEESLNAPNVIVLGDSIATGWGVKNSFADLIETQIGKKGAVLNAGVSSFGTVREMRLLSRINTNALTHLIVQYHWNDQRENQVFTEQGKLPIMSEADREKVLKIYKNRKRYLPGKYFFNSMVALVYPAPKPHPNRAQHFLHSLGVLPSAVDVTVLTLEDAFANELAAQLAQRTTHPAIRMLSMEQHLAPEDFYRLDDHPKLSGHKKMAQEYFRAISK